MEILNDGFCQRTGDVVDIVADPLCLFAVIVIAHLDQHGRRFGAAQLGERARRDHTDIARLAVDAFVIVLQQLRKTLAIDAGGVIIDFDSRVLLDIVKQE